MILLQILFLLLVLVLALPVVILFIQIIVSLFSSKSKPFVIETRPRLLVLVPAHNESLNILPTLASVKSQLKHDDRVVVVADNCTDDTASVARSTNVEVVERTDAVKRGKGYALDFGIRFIESGTEFPEVVVIVDADCLLEQGALDRLSQQAATRQVPIQALYLMHSPSGAGLKTKIAEFAWTVKNWARALGYSRLGLPCQLMGTGMAFPWSLIKKAELASGHIVEDLKLGLDFAYLSLAPHFCPTAKVTSTFPLNKDGIKSQRTRWEHGHLGMIVKEGPTLLWKSVKAFNIGMLVLVLDMCIPPLALLSLLVMILSMLGVILMVITDQHMPWILGTIPFFLLVTSVMMAWWKFGRGILSFTDLAYIPVYILLKIPVYIKFIVKRQVNWVRSRRD